ncbi:MAG: DUF3168 domain-containing protein [Parvularculaceae bacterium]
MTDAAFALHRAVYAALLADDGVTSRLGAPARLYDVEPADRIYPFATFGDWRVAPLAGVEGAFEHLFRLRAYSRYEGRRETRGVLDAFYEALHGAPIAPDGHDLVSLRLSFSDVLPGPDGETWGGVARFRAVTQRQEA